VLTLLPVVLILREPDLGTALVFPPVVFTMLLATGVSRRLLAALLLTGLLSAPILWTQMSREQRSRVTSLFDQAGPGESATGDNYHLRQAKQMLALGGIWGSLVNGPTVDDPAAYHLPEARSDFIFCVLKERLGLPGAGLILALYAAIVWRGFEIAAATREPFGRLVAAGLTTLVAVQVLINTGMNVGLLPITGLPLPLISYGGSSLVSNGLLLGLLVNISIRPGYEISREPFGVIRYRE
jgi:cell division protein FtsW (lipid II flippase)